jgi:light-regulated signal transduction histidine kinase (bacteriophytochrome)
LEEYTEVLAPEARGYLERIRSNARNMGCMIDGLLAFSRLGRQVLSFHTINTAMLVEECLDTLRTAHAGRDVEIALGNLPECNGDPIMLRQVWMNLLDNAFKFTSTRENARIEISGRSENGEHTYKVRDNGAGFDMRYAGKLFNVFQRFHGASEFPGNGVGLATVQRVVHRHGGRVWAEAEAGRGATIHFTLNGEAPDQ